MTETSRLYLPSLKGHIGDWVYYSCLMPMGEISERVAYAKELHPQTERLSDLLQRSLKEGRGQQIAEYLMNESERFFNALVVAVYGGAPEWHEFGNITPRRPDISIDDISPAARESVGFLSFSGKESLFALDGQHRLAGIQQACGDDASLIDEEVPIVFVAHRNSAAGLRRTRRLFTTLNKRARPVSKGEIISLDEDDAMAICVRRLVEDHKHFKGDRIAYSPTNNIPSGNVRCLTTIGNLYDVLKILFTRVESNIKQRPKDVLYYRPPEKLLDTLYDFAVHFFETLAQHNRPLRQFFDAQRYGRVVARYRGEFGGHLLFRPIGLSIVTRVIAELSKDYTVEEAVKYASWLPCELNEAPLRDVVWDSSRQAMNKPTNEALVRRLYLYMLGYDQDVEELANSYAVAVGAPGDTERFEREVVRVVRDE